MDGLHFTFSNSAVRIQRATDCCSWVLPPWCRVCGSRRARNKACARVRWTDFTLLSRTPQSVFSGQQIAVLGSSPRGAGSAGHGERGIRLAPEFDGRTSLYFLELRSPYSAGNRLLFLGPPPVVP